MTYFLFLDINDILRIETSQIKGENIMKEKKGFKTWVKEHQSELILTGVVTVASMALVYIGIQKKVQILKSIGKTGTQLIEPHNQRLSIPVQTEISEVPDSIVRQSILEVEKHIRNLPEGYHASFEKKTSAADHGFELLENQTWVDDYTKGRSVA